VDELAAFRYPDAWDQLGLGMRLGEHPRGIVSTTPRPTKLIRSLLSDPNVAVTRGTTYDNAGNLAPAFLHRVLARYEGTTLGRQELAAEILSETPGALWRLAMLDELRVKTTPCELRRVVVAVDPSVTSGSDSAECGIVVVARGDDGHGYVLEDLSERLSPLAWARKAIGAVKQHQADRIVGEVNNGGDLIATVIRQVDPNAPYTAVRASRGKVARAEPIAALYEQKRVHHVGAFATLEDQMTNYTGSPGEESPDRMDALVWGLTELFEGTAQLVAPPSSLDMPPPWRV
jgi:phage terminase large subunit-like protein